MRKFIIDTDTGSDDASAIMMAVASPDVEILGITTLAGNISLEQATKNATAAGEQFAKDADARLGKIKSANQGVFSIESRDPTDSWSSNERQAINKKVRVVATITFYLK